MKNNLDVSITETGKTMHHSLVNYFINNPDLDKNLTVCCQSEPRISGMGKSVVLLECAKCGKDVTMERLCIETAITYGPLNT